jgi:hypothetical protein
MPLITTSIVASELAPRNSARKSILFQNESAADNVYIKRERSEATTVSATDHDHRLGPGGIFSLNNTLDGIEAIKGRYTCIASANAPVVSVYETEDIIR